MIALIDKDPDAMLRFGINWRKWLFSAVTTEETPVGLTGRMTAGPPPFSLAQSTWTIEPADGSLQIAGDFFEPTISVIRLVGGVVGQEYTVTNTITASNDDTDVRSLRVRVVKR